MASREIRYTNFDKIASACNAISEEISDPSGFVKMGRLLERFGAQIFVRPLLVEGMLASIDQGDDSSGTQWAVFVDGDKYDLTEAEVFAETQDNPLPFRFRNTIAHELVHSLAFRTSEFGISLRNRISDSAHQQGLIKEIERETEKLSPLLLCPYKALFRLTSGRRDSLDARQLAEAQAQLGISREVLVNRMCLLEPGDPLRSAPAIRNISVGIAEWERGGKATIRKWPIFANFDRDIVPEPLLKVLAGRDRISADQIFPDMKFMMCGGTELTSEFVSRAGTRAVPGAKEMRVKVEFETGGWRPGEDFLFTVSTVAGVKLAE